MLIRAVLIDDERPALRNLEYLLGDQPEIEIAGMFVNPLEALDKIGQIKPQIVFLDLNMPQLQGIDVAARILDLCPETDIIFVTAYDQYAIEAFELHALDYLLKPIARERFAKTLLQYGIDPSLVSITGSYILKLGLPVDVQLFRERLQEINSEATIDGLEAVTAIYTGEYFAGSDWPWADLERERLARQYSEVALRLSRAYLEKGEFARAEELLLKAFAGDPYAENITELLLQVYRKMGARAKAARHYREYSRILEEDLGLKPSEQIRKLYDSVT